jgi:hypothetical protein
MQYMSRNHTWTPNSLLKNAFVAFFNLARHGAKLRAAAQNNDLRRNVGIAFLRFRSLSILQQAANVQLGRSSYEGSATPLRQVE